MWKVTYGWSAKEQVLKKEWQKSGKDCFSASYFTALGVDPRVAHVGFWQYLPGPDSDM